MTAMQTVTHHGGEQGDGKTVHRIHFLSQVDDSRCESVDVLACRVGLVNPRTVNADGVMILFQSNIAEIAVVDEE